MGTPTPVRSRWPFQTFEVISGPIEFIADDIRDIAFLENIIIDGEGDVAVNIQYPHADSSIWPTVILQNVIVRGRWKKAFNFWNCWNGVAIDCYALWHARDGRELSHPVATHGFDLGNSMDFNVVRPRVNGYQAGVRVMDIDLKGHGEGCHVNGGWLMNVDYGVRFEGFGSGGWPTPHGVVDGGVHIAANKAGVYAEKYSGLKIVNNDLYGTEWAEWPFGVELNGCRDVQLSNRHWINRTSAQSKIGAAMLIQNSQNVSIYGSQVSEGLAGALVDINSDTVFDETNRWPGKTLGKGVWRW